MANYCSYKVIVKGKKNACYAFFGSMSCLDDKWIVEENGTESDYSVRFEGNCKWSVDAYCTPWGGAFPVALPEDADEAMRVADENYWYNTVRERSKMFAVEVWCNSADVEDFDPDLGPNEIFEHYANGVPVDSECPVLLRIWMDDEEDVAEEEPLSVAAILDGATSIDDAAFSNRDDITDITIPDGVTHIGHGAFCGCTNLIRVSIPNSVTSIGCAAFSGCTNLTEIHIPDSVTDIGDLAFARCNGLADVNGFVVIRGQLCQYVGNDQQVVVPDHVTAIGDAAFNGCRDIVSVTIPEGVTRIGSCAFKGCRKLMNVDIPRSVTDIAAWAFRDCRSLAEIHLHSGITSIDDEAFDPCSKLTIHAPIASYALKFAQRNNFAFVRTKP